MKKIALLIGISEYKGKLTPLPGAQRDIQAMEHVLKHPNMGGFDHVDLLENPERIAMEQTIENLFRDAQPDDLILLYFSGHGIKDEDEKLYFATSQTTLTSDERLNSATAIEARVVQKKYMDRSRSKRQVVILDCCFSGAFSEEEIARGQKSLSLDIRGQLGGEGRVVLTSSTETQDSFEDDNGGIYTGYLVEGIENGSADTNGDGWITVAELHEFAKDRTQVAKPSMTPTIDFKGDGGDIKVAKALIDNPKVKYRKEVEQLAKERSGKFSDIALTALKARAEALMLSTEEAEVIIHEVLKPYRQREANLKRYEQTLTEALRKSPQLSEQDKKDLTLLQQNLGLQKEDVKVIWDRVQKSTGKKRQTEPTHVARPSSMSSRSTPVVRGARTPSPKPAQDNSELYGSLLINGFFAISTIFYTIALTPGAYFFLGQIYYVFGNKKEAITSYNKAIVLDPEYPNPYKERGGIYSQLGNASAAINDYTNFLTLQPNEAPYIYVWMGDARLKSGDNRGAVTEYTRAIGLKPDYARAHYNQAFAHLGLGSKSSAVWHFQRAADLYQMQGKKKEHERALRRIKEIQP
jgi:uncharacterized caspase-like protein